MYLGKQCYHVCFHFFQFIDFDIGHCELLRGGNEEREGLIRLFLACTLLAEGASSPSKVNGRQS
jgi:hypothetical protein